MKLTPTSRKGISNMGLTRVALRLRSFISSDSYQSQFLVDTGATGSLAPAFELKKIGIKAIGKMAYELATGTIVEYEFGLAEISFMNETTAGRIIFGPDNVEPLSGRYGARVSWRNNRSYESRAQKTTGDSAEIVPITR